ncbi:MAG TPA: polyprenyl synthetase family protein [Chloroflexota bacterium]|nr:polyprenyl synthetase family protein [Chloroflexota bacterium]
MLQSVTAEMAPTSFLDVLAEKRQMLWPVVKSYLDDLWAPAIDRYAAGREDVARFHQQLVSEYPRRQGKYLRPALLLLTCEALGGDPRQAIPSAAAMQLSEDWLLVHDDCEDGSPRRRGGKALPRLYGCQLAINAGDALHLLMWRVLQDNFRLLPQHRARAVLQAFSDLLTRTAFGQTVELKWTRDRRHDLTEADWFFLADNKTAYYTVAGPMLIGALIAGAHRAQSASIERFGLLLGKSFQVVDDLLDLVSDFDGLKGPNGGDIIEGKQTLVLIHLLKVARGPDRDALLQILGKPRSARNRQDVRTVIELMRAYGSLDYARGVALRLAAAATRAFDRELGFLAREPARMHLRSCITFVVSRRL